MLTTFIFACCLAAPNAAFDPDEAPPVSGLRLALVPNATTIRQRDPLFVMAIVENRTKLDIRLKYPPRKTAGDRFSLVIRGPQKSGWQRAWTMCDVASGKAATGEGFGDAEPRPVPIVSGVSYAQHISLHCQRAFVGDFHRREPPLDFDYEFVFDEPGKYEICAVATTNFGDLTSSPVVITVERRNETEMQRVAEEMKILRRLSDVSLKWKAEELAKLESLQELGGNVGLASKNLLLTRAYLAEGHFNGDKIAADKIGDFVKVKLDPVSSDLAFLRIADCYCIQKNMLDLASLVRTLPHDSDIRRRLLRSLRFPAGPNVLTRHDLGETGVYEPIEMK